MELAIVTLSAIAKPALGAAGLLATLDGCDSEGRKILDWCRPMTKTSAWASETWEEVRKVRTATRLQRQTLDLAIFKQLRSDLDGADAEAGSDCDQKFGAGEAGRDGLVDTHEGACAAVERCERGIRRCRRLLKEVVEDERGRWSMSRMRETHARRRRIERQLEKLEIDQEAMKGAMKILELAISTCNYLELRQQGERGSQNGLLLEKGGRQRQRQRQRSLGRRARIEPDRSRSRSKRARSRRRG